MFLRYHWAQRKHTRRRFYHVGHDVAGKSKLSYVGDSRGHRREPKDDRKHPLLEALASIMTALSLSVSRGSRLGSNFSRTSQPPGLITQLDAPHIPGSMGLFVLSLNTYFAPLTSVLQSVIFRMEIMSPQM